MSLPVLDIAELSESRAAARRFGCFYVAHPRFSRERCVEALADAREFFSLSPAAKASVAIEASPHWRGYSEMRNTRDWREQIHFGREEPAIESGAEYNRL